MWSRSKVVRVLLDSLCLTLVLYIIIMLPSPYTSSGHIYCLEKEGECGEPMQRPTCTSSYLPSYFKVRYVGYQYPIGFYLVNNSILDIEGNLSLILSLRREKDYYIFSIHIDIPKATKLWNKTAVQVSNIIFEGNFTFKSLESLNLTLFLVNPKELVEGRNIHILTFQEYTLIGKVHCETTLPTSKEGRKVKGILVSGIYYRRGSEYAPAVLGYDKKTGVLVHWGARLIDPLLMKLGIKDIVGGGLLLDYFEGIDLNIVETGEYFAWYTYIIYPIILFVLITLILLLREYKRRRKHE